LIPLADKTNTSHTPRGEDIDRRNHTCSSRAQDRRTSMVR
jgi:hypothetical protein